VHPFQAIQSWALMNHTGCYGYACCTVTAKLICWLYAEAPTQLLGSRFSACCPLLLGLSGVPTC